MSSRIPIMEIFGPTIQGEGNLIGSKTMFIRTGGCDYSCSWCDSSFTWNGEQKAQMLTIDEIYNELTKLGTKGVDWVTISGGNPALVGETMSELIAKLHSEGFKVALETQGSIWQPWMVDINNLVLSPKPPSSGMNPDFIKLAEIIEKYTASINSDNSNDIRDNNVNKDITQNISNDFINIDNRPHRKLVLKVVIFDDEDFEYAKYLYGNFNDVPFYLQVGNTNIAEGDENLNVVIERLEWLTQKLIEEESMSKASVLPQLHVLIWGNKRGV